MLDVDILQAWVVTAMVNCMKVRIQNNRYYQTIKKENDMKTKEYIFTESEIYTIREALIEYYHILKSINPMDIAGIQNKNNAKALKDQFKIDAANI